MAMPGVPVSRLVIDPAAEPQLEYTLYDPAHPGVIIEKITPRISTAIHTPAIPANRHGIGAKGASSLYVTLREQADSTKPGRPTVLSVEWDEPQVYVIGSHVNKGGVNVNDLYKCIVQ